MRKRTDNVQKDIVNGLRKYGVSVAIISDTGGGVPDLLCGYGGINYLVEAKDPKRKDSSIHTYTDAQRDFRRDWNGEIITARSLDEAWEQIKNKSIYLIMSNIKDAVL